MNRTIWWQSYFLQWHCSVRTSIRSVRIISWVNVLILTRIWKRCDDQDIATQIMFLQSYLRVQMYVYGLVGVIKPEIWPDYNLPFHWYACHLQILYIMSVFQSFCIVVFSPHCTKCPAGYECPGPYTVHPVPCPRAWYRAADETSIRCQPCPVGTWSPFSRLKDGNSISTSFEACRNDYF